MLEKPHAGNRLTPAFMSHLLAKALEAGVVGGRDDVVIFYDLTRLDKLLASLASAFPTGTLHAVAVKANPLVEVLKRIRISGHGAEVASMGEVQLALAAGHAPDTIVFDSPAKSRTEIRTALELGIRINANSLDEVHRLALARNDFRDHGQIGLRVNPQIGEGSISSTSVAARRSKFGVRLEAQRGRIAETLADCPWITGLHTHIGSQGMSVTQLVKGIGTVYDFFTENSGRNNVRTFNVGGGLPVQYRESDENVDFSEYARQLRERCPKLFDSDIELVTEFGRALHASCGWVASRVEYVTDDIDVPILVTHAGADIFLREAYCPRDWHHKISLSDSQGNLRGGTERTFDIAGPLCFAGDYLARGVRLPEDASEGDFVLVHDAGAYTFSMWSVYNSRKFPLVLGYEGSGERFYRLRRSHTDHDTVNFWSR